MLKSISVSKGLLSENVWKLKLPAKTGEKTATTSTKNCGVKIVLKRCIVSQKSAAVDSTVIKDKKVQRCIVQQRNSIAENVVLFMLILALSLCIH